MAECYSLLLLLSFLRLGSTVLPDDHLKNVLKKFEYKYSFKPPMLVNAKGEVPFWERGGDAIPTSSQIRVCPSIQDRKGWLWSKNTFDKANWMIDVEFSISGKHSFGADGMAFWYTATKGYSGPVYGNTNNFIGLGVVIDTFDNDGMGDSPKISVYVNDGSLLIDQGKDGSSQDLGHCIKFVRNKRFSPKMKIVYNQKRLEVWVHEGDSEDKNAYDLCAQLDNVPSLPSSGHFGVTAATGGLSDDHDVKSFLVHSLISMEEYKQKMIDKYDSSRMKEMEGEYQKKAESFDSRKSQYRKEHHKENEMEWEKRVELEENIQLIYDMQHSLFRKMKDITNQLEQTRMSGGGGGSDSTVLAVEERMTSHIKDMKSLINKGIGGNNNLPTSEQMQPLYAMKETVQELLRKVEQLQSQVQSSGSGVTSSSTGSCLSTWFFVSAMLVQLFIVVGFLYYKHSQERNAKKFF